MNGFPFAPSPRATELSGKVVETVEAYRRTHPDLSGWEIRIALRLAARSTAYAPRRVIIVAALAAAAAGFALAFAPGNPMGRSYAIALAVVVGSLLLWLAFRALISNR